MNLKQIEYIVAIAQEKNISRAAAKLFVSQPNLSQTLLNLEQELGVPLFNRVKNAWTLTYAGEVYINAANEILNIKKQTYRTIEDIVGVKKGHFVVGITPERGALMFSNVFPEFHEKYPGIKIDIVEARVKKQVELTEKGEIDIAFPAMDKIDNSLLNFEEICEEELVLAVPKGHRFAKLSIADSFGELPRIDLSLLDGEDFILARQDTKTRDLIDSMFEEAKVKPNVLFEGINTNMMHGMVKNGVGLTFIPKAYASKNDRVVYFSTNPSRSWYISVAYRKDRYLTRAERDFIEMAKSYHINREKYVMENTI